MPLRDGPTSYQLAALSGGLLWTMAKVFAVVFAPSGPVGRRDVLRAFAEGVFSIISALISAAWVSPAFVSVMGIHNEQMIGLLYLVVGIIFWQSVPILILMLSRWFPSTFMRMLPTKGADHEQ